MKKNYLFVILFLWECETMKEIFEKLDTKKIIMIIGGIVGIVVVFLILNVIGTKMFSKSSYADVENIMKNAAISYYDDNPGELPNQIGNTLEVDVSELITSKYMKSIDSYIKNDSVSCDGSVNVTNINGNYRYVPILDCGDEYFTNTLVEYIMFNEDVVESGSGLYSVNDEFVYRGEEVNNYVMFGENSYRIMKIVDDHVVLVYNDIVTNMVWDDRYNVDKKVNVGINDYSVSRVREYLQELYEGNTLFGEEEKLLLSSYDVAIGKRTNADEDKTGAIEKTNVLEDQYISLITLSDFFNASLDSNCMVSDSVACINYNYFMDIGSSFWTGTASADSSYRVYKIDRSLGAVLANASSSSAIVPVVHLVSDAVYVEGDGTEKNPYIFK